MTTAKKLYAEFIWEDVYLEKVTRTFTTPDHDTAVAYGVQNHALYFTTFEAETPAGKPAATGGRYYTATMESELNTASRVIEYLEDQDANRATRNFQDEVLPRMFGRVSRDQSLQDKFNAATANADPRQRLAEVIGLLRQDDPNQVFLTPGHGGFIRMEEGDVSYGPDLKPRYPASATVPLQKNQPKP